MARIALSDLTPWITEAVLAHPQDLPAYLCQRLGLSRTSARTQLNKLVEAQWLARDGVSRKAVYKPGALRQVVRRYPLQGLQEDLAAVTAGLTLEWSNGVTEGQIHRLKLVKRQGHGRASYGACP